MRLLYIVSHPIQYQASLLRKIATESGVRLRVLFLYDSESGYFDHGFSRDVRWDIPLREGYDSILWEQTDWRKEISNHDVVWFHGWQGFKILNAIAYAHAMGRPILMRAENTNDAMPDGRGLKGVLKRRFLKWIFDRCTLFLSIGSANRDYYLRHGITADRIFPMPYAVDNDFFAENARAAQPHRAAMRRSLELGGEPIILYAGKLTARKHPERLIRAWASVSWSGNKPILLFVGDGEMRNVLKKNAPSDVHFLGFRNQTEMPAVYDLADVFVLPAEREPWGLAVNESMACGTAVVVSDRVGCAPDLVDQACGAIVPFGDDVAMGRALIDVLGRAESAGQAAQRKIANWNFAADIRGLHRALDSLPVNRARVS